MPNTAVVIRFAGDSGDGMQITGHQVAHTSAVAGYAIQTKPTFPAEIRAPSGSLAGVSSYQLQFADHEIYTAGDACDVLVAMNPAALKVHGHALKKNGTLLINEESFTEKALEKATYTQDPLSDGSFISCAVHRIPMTALTLSAVAPHAISHSQAMRCKNMFALGVIYYLHDQTLASTEQWLRKKFAHEEAILNANLDALLAGYAYAQASELLPLQQGGVTHPALSPGQYKQLNGNEGFALGAVAAAIAAQRPLFVAGYPITPASTLLHYLARYKDYPVHVTQAEDEIAAACMAIGAAYGGHLALTCTSGPGLDLKTEALGFAVMTELPVVVVDVQRAGPATGMPTKSEQSDLGAAIWGRHGESPVIVVAPRDQADCYTIMLEAFALATQYMTPVIVLGDAQLSGGSMAWRIPELPATIDVTAASQVRDWVVPGTPGETYRLGGLEKDLKTGQISYDAANHHAMMLRRHAKIAHAATRFKPTEHHGASSGRACFVGWGGTYGQVYSAWQRLAATHTDVAYVHLRYLNPLPQDVSGLLNAFDHIIVCEQNLGQAQQLLSAHLGRACKHMAVHEGIDLLTAMQDVLTTCEGAQA